MRTEPKAAGFRPERALDLGNAGESPRSQSLPCLSSSGTRTARSQARTHSSERELRCASSVRAPLRRHAAHNYIRSYMLMQTICLCKQYACATALQKLIDVLHVHLLGGRQAEHRALSPRGRTAGRASDPRERRWI